MRVLWLVSTAANFSTRKQHLYNGCGWIASLENNLKYYKGIELGQAFFVRSNETTTIIDGVRYYPIKDPYASKIRVILSLFTSPKKIDKIKLSLLSQVVNDFKPDIIQVFGSEEMFGEIIHLTKVPVVIHIQGIINPYLSSFLPPFMSWKDYPRIANNLKQRVLRLFDKKNWTYKAKREVDIIRNNHYFIGRTDWDKRITELYNPNAQYYNCWEIMRSPFYMNKKNRIQPQKLTLVSTISNTSYKGFDVILKTANILKNVLFLDFEWLIFGGVNANFYERIYHLNSTELNIQLRGVGSPEDIIESILRATAYIHLSYIDNSPNSICEAMLLGCPVIGCSVGGVPSLITDGETGFLVPSNDPFQTASFIKQIYINRAINEAMGIRAKEVALKRHNIESICDNMMAIYDVILKENCNSQNEV